jgi:hypothetical protein
VAGCCEYGDEPSGSGAMELVSSKIKEVLMVWMCSLHWGNWITQRFYGKIF